MPNRILREGILTSRRMAKLGWAEEVFYRRLMSIVDDFGRYYADAGLLHSACYPRQLTKVSDSDIGKWLTACVNAALVRVYPASDGESYLQLLDFGQQVRAKKSRFPDPLCICVADDEHPPADAPVFVSEVVFESPLTPKGAMEGFERFYAAYPRKVAPDKARKAFEKVNPDEATLARILSAIAAQVTSPEWLKEGGQFIPYPATWLNGGHWKNGVDMDGGSSQAWHETGGGIKAKGAEIGIPYAAEDDCKPFDAYRKRVFMAAGHRDAA